LPGRRVLAGCQSPQQLPLQLPPPGQVKDVQTSHVRPSQLEPHAFPSMSFGSDEQKFEPRLPQQNVLTVAQKKPVPQPEQSESLLHVMPPAPQLDPPLLLPPLELLLELPPLELLLLELLLLELLPLELLLLVQLPPEVPPEVSPEVSSGVL